MLLKTTVGYSEYKVNTEALSEPRLDHLPLWYDQKTYSEKSRS